MTQLAPPGVIFLAPDNFTSPTRTPWGGRRIARVLKSDIVAESPAIGESWELSAGPEFPSRLAGEERTLDALVRSAPAAMLGREAHRGSTALLLKLLDAAESLSVQIHPRDDDPLLTPQESGKPESWYVEHAEPGAGIFFGLAESTTEASMARALAEGADVSALLSFVPVAPGDFFVVDAGTPHAIGAGVTVVEPQRVLPGRLGVTYRYWDWNRRYDAAGMPSASGALRELHVDRALAVTNWSRLRGDAFLAETRFRAGPPSLLGRAALTPLCGGEGARLFSDALEVFRLAGDGPLALPPLDALRSLTVLEGEVRVAGRVITKGRTVAIPAAAPTLDLECVRACAILAAAR